MNPSERCLFLGVFLVAPPLFAVLASSFARTRRHPMLVALLWFCVVIGAAALLTLQSNLVAFRSLPHQWMLIVVMMVCAVTSWVAFFVLLFLATRRRPGRGP